MTEAGIGRILVASLHQGISDVLPMRLEFYESWLNPDGLRHGTIGLAPLHAVLSFLRQEGESYRLATERAGAYAAEWTVHDQWPPLRNLIRALPLRLRARVVLRVARLAIRRSYAGSRAVVRMRRGRGTIDVRGSVFCTVRDPVPAPLCYFHAAAASRFLQLYAVPGEVRVGPCRAVGDRTCLLEVTIGPQLPADPAGEVPA